MEEDTPGRQKHSVPELKKPHYLFRRSLCVGQAGVDAIRPETAPTHPQHPSPGTEADWRRRSAIFDIQTGLPEKLFGGSTGGDFLGHHLVACDKLPDELHDAIDFEISERYDDPDFPSHCREARSAR